MADPLRLPRVKVCGLARPEDVAVALEAGADGLGFVLHPASPRAVDAATARRLAAHVPSEVTTVAVVVDATPGEALDLLDASGLEMIQLCGAQRAADWNNFPRPILRRIPVEPGAEAELASWAAFARGFVLDHPSTAGGSGRTVDLDLAAEFCSAFPCLLAGGLDALRVGDAVLTARPYGVDASSRLERAPGEKDPDAVRRFVLSALEAFRELNV